MLLPQLVLMFMTLHQFFFDIPRLSYLEPKPINYDIINATSEPDILALIDLVESNHAPDNSLRHSNKIRI